MLRKKIWNISLLLSKNNKLAINNLSFISQTTSLKYSFGFLSKENIPITKSVKEEKIFKKFILDASNKSISKTEELNPVANLIKANQLTYEDISLITKSLVSINRTFEEKNKKEILEKIMSAAGESILKMPVEKLQRSSKMFKALSDFASFCFISGIRNDQLLEHLIKITSENEGIFKDLNSYSQYIYTLSQKDYRTIDQKYLASLFQSNINLLTRSLSIVGPHQQSNVNKVTYIVHLFNKIQLDINQMDPVISLLISDYLKMIEGKNLSLLIRLVTRTESSFNKYCDQIKPLILARLAELDLIALSQFLYAFYRVSTHIEQSRISIPEIRKILDEIQKKLPEETAELGKNENKALTSILVFLREFLYDDVLFLQELTDVIKTLPSSEIHTITILVHTITTLNMQELYKELPPLYEKVLALLKENKTWNIHHLDNLKMIWNSMTISQVYNQEFIELALDIFLKDGMKSVPHVSIKPTFINVYEGMLLHPEFSQAIQEKLLKLKDIIVERYHKSREGYQAYPSSDTLFQDQISMILMKNNIEFTKEKQVELFFVDYALKNSNIVIECLGPIHFTLFKKRYNGTTQLRRRLLEAFGCKVVTIEYEAWLSWKQHNITEEKVIALIKEASSKSDA